MFAVRLSLKKSKKLLFIAVAALVLTAVCAFAAVNLFEKPRDTAQSGKTGSYSLNVQNGGYSAFFAQIGLQTGDTPQSEKTVLIPGEFDEVYSAYNELQQAAGLDLTPYKGTEAKLLTFPLNSGKADFAVLLVKHGRVIGGHLTNGEYGSEMLPLTE